MKQFNLEEYLKNPSRKVVTRDGRSVKIHCANYLGNHPVIAQVENSLYSTSYNAEDRYVDIDESPRDLFFAPEKHEGWLNIYHSESGFYLRGNPYKSKEEADEVAKANYKTFCTTVKIEWEE